MTTRKRIHPKFARFRARRWLGQSLGDAADPARRVAGTLLVPSLSACRRRFAQSNGTRSVPTTLPLAAAEGSRRRIRLWLLVAIATLFAPLPVAAQMRVQADDVGLIDDVDHGLIDAEIDLQPTSQAIKAIERELDQFVRAKLALVRLVCAPTDEQLAVLQRSGERLVVEEITAVRNGLEHGIQPWVQFADDATAREKRLERLKPLFDESQWELFERMLDPRPQGRLP